MYPVFSFIAFCPLLIIYFTLALPLIKVLGSLDHGLHFEINNQHSKTQIILNFSLESSWKILIKEISKRKTLLLLLRAANEDILAKTVFLIEPS